MTIDDDAPDMKRSLPMPVTPKLYKYKHLSYGSYGTTRLAGNKMK